VIEVFLAGEHRHHNQAGHRRQDAEGPEHQREHDPFDPAGDGARDSLIERANSFGIEAIVLSPTLGDFNEDLRRIGISALWANVRGQLAPEDVVRFIATDAM